MKLNFCLITVAIIGLTVRQSDAFTLAKTTTTLATNFHSFKNWMLEKHPAAPKKALIENTVLKARYPLSKTVTWAKAKISADEFNRLIKKPVKSTRSSIIAARGLYDYTPNNDFWVDFANASTFGGGFQSNGNVQEERMFMEFPQLAQLAYAKKSNQILPVSSGCKLPRLTTSCAEPFLIFNVIRTFDISDVPYGRAILDTKPQAIPGKITRPLHSPIAHIIGLAAINWCDKGVGPKKYTMEDLKYLLKAALLGNLGAIKYSLEKAQGTPEIHSGNWGAGAFKNSITMITAIQILAGAMAQLKYGSTLVGINLFLHSDRNLVEDLSDDILDSLSNGITPEELLKKFLKRQSDNPWIWAPQKC